MTDEADQPSFARFSAAMDAAREAGAPQLMLYDETAAAAAPAVGRLASWRGLRRPLGIGGGVALVVALALTLLTPPIGAALGWLNGAALPAHEEKPAAEPSTASRSAPQPAAAPREAPPLPRSALADEAARAAGPQVGSAPESKAIRVTALAATARPPAHSLPVPTFKPSAATP